MASKPTVKTATGFTRYDAILAEANRLNQVAPPYNNARPPSDGRGYDCSSSCADLMLKAGYHVPYFTTATAPQYMSRGVDPTGRVTFWNDDHGGVGGNSVHIFATLNGRDWGTGANSQGGPGWHPHTKSGFAPYHINGLDEQASMPKNPDTSTGGTSTGNNGVDLNAVESISKAASFSAFLELPGALDSAESLALTGARSLMNDQPLFPFIQQLAEASLRRFQSMPNGNFFAFYPDYFGGLNHRTPYWKIEDIEILDGQIQLSDDQLATHVFVVGDTIGMWDGVSLEIDGRATAGVVNMFTAFAADFIKGVKDPTAQFENNPTLPSKDALLEKDQVITFLQKYGARPLLETAPMVRSHYYELFLAYQKFCLTWAQQFKTTFQFTYMPELFPGGIVAFPDHGIQMFVEEVNHIFDYESGFETQAMLSAPAALPNSGMDGVLDGMLRAAALTPPLT